MYGLPAHKTQAPVHPVLRRLQKQKNRKPEGTQSKKINKKKTFLQSKFSLGFTNQFEY